MKTFIVSKYQRLKNLYVKYERWLMPATLVGGFLIDYITFTNVRLSFTFGLLIFYWILAGLLIVFTHAYDANKLPTNKILNYIRLFSPLAVQFSFGALLGSSLIFYWFSGAFAVSWPLMAIIVLLMVFNEAFRYHFEKPLVQISVYFFATISLLSLSLPFLFKSLSAWLFVIASVLSLIIFLPGIYYLSRWMSNIRAERKGLFVSMIGIAIIMNVLYFANIIPPIPLALREAGMYHDISVVNGKYIMQSEPENVSQAIDAIIFGQTLHVKEGSKVYAYTAIFAPNKLQATIVHNWQYYDTKEGKWVSKNKLTFNINGGRKEGYKGYSWGSNLAPGRWRVSVENVRGQILGRVRFIVEKVEGEVKLQEVVR